MKLLPSLFYYIVALAVLVGVSFSAFILWRERCKRWKLENIDADGVKHYGEFMAHYFLHHTKLLLLLKVLHWLVIRTSDN
jgi:uncharacterized iron-regulated membrane protein